MTDGVINILLQNSDDVTGRQPTQNTEGVAAGLLTPPNAHQNTEGVAAEQCNYALQNKEVVAAGRWIRNDHQNKEDVAAGLLTPLNAHQNTEGVAAVQCNNALQNKEVVAAGGWIRNDHQNKPEGVDARSINTLNPFRGKPSAQQGLDELRCHVNKEIKDTKEMISQQSDTLMQVMAAIKRLERGQKNNEATMYPHSAHSLSDEDLDNYLSDVSDNSDPYNQEDNEDNNRQSSKLQKLQGLFVESTDFGPAIQDNLAETVNRGIKQNFDLKVGLDQGEKYKTPENCQLFTVPKLNEEMQLEDTISVKYKSSDAILQKNQQLLTKGMIPLVLMMDHMIKMNAGDETLFDLATDSLQMLTFAHRDLSNIRRKFLMPAVQRKYHKLCAQSNPVSTKLFGDDLDSQLKAIADRKQIGAKISAPEHKTNKRMSGYRYRPYLVSRHNGGDKRQARSFLDKRPAPKGRHHVRGYSRQNQPVPRNSVRVPSHQVQPRK